MGTAADMMVEVRAIYSKNWTISDGQVVPAPESLVLGNEAKHFDRATILYADLSGSTNLVDDYFWQVAGEIYKAYLSCAAKLIKSEGGSIVSYDGDRVMGVFIGSSQTTTAARCALKINWAVLNVVNPLLITQYPHLNGLTVKQVVGIDTGEIRAARIGIRGGNDLVWIGRAANYAAKLTNLDDTYSTWITGDAYNRLHITSKEGGDPKRSMWTQHTWNANKDLTVYGSTWSWAPR